MNIPSDLRKLENCPTKGYDLFLRSAFRPPSMLILPSVCEHPQPSDQMPSDQMQGHFGDGALKALDENEYLQPLEFKKEVAAFERISLTIQLNIRAGEKNDDPAENGLYILKRIIEKQLANEVVLSLAIDSFSQDRLVRTSEIVHQIVQQKTEASSSIKISIALEGQLADSDVTELLAFLNNNPATVILTIPQEMPGLPNPTGSYADAVYKLARTGRLISLSLGVDDSLDTDEAVLTAKRWVAISRGGGMLIVPKKSYNGNPALSIQKYAEILMSLYKENMLPSDRLYPINLFLCALAGWMPGYCYSRVPYPRIAVNANNNFLPSLIECIERDDHPLALRQKIVNDTYTGKHKISADHWCFLLLSLLDFGCYDGGLSEQEWRWLHGVASHCCPFLLREAAGHLFERAERQVEFDIGASRVKKVVYEKGSLVIKEV